MAQHADDPPAAPPPAEPPDNPLFAAIRADNVQRLERALSEGASVDSTAAVKEEEATDFFFGTVTALILAIRLGHNRVARLLLERGADVRARGRVGTTALYFGAGFGNVEMIAALAAAGGDLAAADANGATPIWIGERRGSASITTPQIVAPSCPLSP